MRDKFRAGQFFQNLEREEGSQRRAELQSERERAGQRSYKQHLGKCDVGSVCGHL